MYNIKNYKFWLKLLIKKKKPVQIYRYELSEYRYLAKLWSNEQFILSKFQVPHVWRIESISLMLFYPIQTVNYIVYSDFINDFHMNRIKLHLDEPDLTRYQYSNYWTTSNDVNDYLPFFFCFFYSARSGFIFTSTFI